MKLVDALTLRLKELGVANVFGVGGANIEHFHDAIYRLGDGKINLILAKSEFAAAFMADGLARTHNTLGVCCATSGGGMLNLAVGIAESFADKTPVLAIVGQIPTRLEGQGGFQDSSGKNNSLNALGFWQSMTKYVAKITEPQSFWEYFETALKTIFNPPFGPAVLLIPRDLFEMEVPEPPTNFPKLLLDYRIKKALVPAEEFLSTLKNAKHPLLVIGGDARYIVSRASVNRLVNEFDLKVATTLADVNGFSQEDVHYIGMIGVAGHPSAHQYLQQHSDLIIAIGEDFSTLMTTSIEHALQQIKTIYIGSDATKAKAVLDFHLVIETDVESFLENIPQQQMMLNRRYVFPQHYYRPTVHPKTKKRKTGLLTSQAIQCLQTFIDYPKHIIFDAGNCVVSALHCLQFPLNTKTVISLGMGAMGYAIPAGIGAQLGGVHSHSTWVITGDGGFLISGLEIHTAVEYQLPILFIVFNNNMHGMCVTRQQKFFSNRITASTYGPLEVTKVVKGLGNKKRLWVGCAKNVAHLEKQLKDYYESSSGKPGVLEIKINVDEIPPFIPFLEGNHDYGVRS